MQLLTKILDHAATIGAVLSIFSVFIFPALSRIAKLFGDGPKAVAASKFFDGLGVDTGKASRAVKSLKAPTADEIARAVNTVPPEDEDTETRLNREDVSK